MTYLSRHPTGTVRISQEEEVNMTGLRELLRPHFERLSQHNSHKTLPESCERYALPKPPPSAEGASRRDRMMASFDQVADADLPVVAERLIAHFIQGQRERNNLQDFIWSQQGHPEIPKKVRHEIARAVSIEDLFINAAWFDTLLRNLWVVEGSWLADGLKHEIQQHVHRNRGDWSTEYLFEKLGAFEATDRRFALFLEGLASANVLPDESAQRKFVATVNKCLSACGVELREIGADGGYPAFSIVAIRAGSNRSPKNLIFASSVKPDLRFHNAVDNDIEIVTNADKVLVYDRPIGPEGLLWRDLQQWWADTKNITDTSEAKKTLYWRLHEALPTNSPPQRLLFESFFNGYKLAVPGLPALLPEVWLHWDPKTVKERGVDALSRFRMDFLMLLPRGVRVVLEVDGRQHYADDTGKADIKRYADMVAADRNLRLSGYEVFRFGGFELQGAVNAPKLVKSFFDDLFKHFKVTTPGG